MPGPNRKPYDWQTPFLVALTEVPVLNHACRAAGVDHTTAWRARRDDPEFAEKVERAMEVGIDRAEQEAFRRAVVGYEEPLTHQGHITYHVKRDPATGRVEYDEKGLPILALDENGQPIPLTVRKHSDALLALILKGRRKKVYADRTELTGADGGPVHTIDTPTRAARVAELMAQAAKRAEATDDADGLV